MFYEDIVEPGRSLFPQCVGILEDFFVEWEALFERTSGHDDAQEAEKGQRDRSGRDRWCQNDGGRPVIKKRYFISRVPFTFWLDIVHIKGLKVESAIKEKK